MVLLQAFTAQRLLPSSNNAGLGGWQHRGLTNGSQGTQGTAAVAAGDGDVVMGGTEEVGEARGAAAAGQWEERGAGGEDGTQDQSRARDLPVTLQAHAWIALGKVCLVDEGLAKKCVPLFVQVRL